MTLKEFLAEIEKLNTAITQNAGKKILFSFGIFLLRRLTENTSTML
jgi:hypothetical protein